ncbi:PREDICTED: uncharacterized protein LOC109177564 [Ipomoea nil]|uniref:uncharacterized protein LOC109177564 n=1 Tax=Ipomoea nil TaxID=35883 RepID=UPI000900CC0C|nr:PREDICTED: uncharacterized protein LOC109177564 [Ipomoea nil]
MEAMEKLRPFFNDTHTMELMTLARRYKKVDIYVEHGVEEENEGNPSVDLEETNEGNDDDGEENNDDEHDECNKDDEEAEKRNHGAELKSGATHAPSRKKKHTVQENTIEDDEVDSVYYESDNPPSYQSEMEDDEAQLQLEQSSKAKVKCKFPSYNPSVEFPELELGMFYEDASEFKKAMINYAVHFKRDICYYKNESMRVMFKCVGIESIDGKGCPFHCTASWEEKYKCFQLKTLEANHNCNQKFSLRLVSQSWIEDKYEEKIRDNPCIGPIELKNHIESELKINLSISKVRRAIRSVLKKINASFEDQFRRIRDYAQECMNSNPGSKVKLKTSMVTPDSPCVFQRIYVCFDALRRGFLDGCIKIIGLDGCFLKGLLKGEILTAVGRDANNQMYPIAWAVVEIENTDSWGWFLELLKNDLGITNTYPWTIISDQQKGLTTVIQELFPDSEHRNCARHVHANWSKRHKGKVMKNHFWMCAKSTTEVQFHEQLKALEMRDKEAKADLERYPPKFWCKAFFRTTSKCDIVDNNICEAFNGTLLKARCKPIIPMLEDIRVLAMRRIAKKMKFVDTWKGRYGPLIMKKLIANKKESIGWKVDFNGDDGYEIKKGRNHFKVRLENKTCSCRSWDLTGLPCPHAICAIFDNGRNMEDYLDPCYSKEAYQRTYAHALLPMNGELFWPKTNCEEILAPIPKKMTGRPKKKRNREESEGSSTASKKTQLSRKGRIMRCSICRQEGHTRAKCNSVRGVLG